MSNVTTKAIGYLRVSGKGQVRKDGFPRQAEAIRQYCKANKLELVETYKDGGESGTKDAGDRPGLAALLDRLEHNGVAVVLVESSQRLARDLLVGEVILSQFRKLDVKVIAADSGTDLTAADGDATRVLVRQVLGAIAQFDKSVLVSKLRAARQRMRRTTGRCEGRKRFGYRAGEAETLSVMRKLRRKPRGKEPMSYAKIAAELNRLQRPTRSGKPWQPRTVCQILTRK